MSDEGREEMEEGVDERVGDSGLGLQHLTCNPMTSQALLSRYGLSFASSRRLACIASESDSYSAISAIC